MSEPVRTSPEDNSVAMTPVVVKKYANRRLYNTESSSYITLDNLAEMIRLGRDFVVYDAKSGDDITRGVLTQIIVEEEGKGRAMLPTNFLRHLIGLYGDNVQNLVPRYLDDAMAAFALQQKQVREAMQKTVGRIFPFGNIEEVSRQNIAMMERAMSLWSPFYRPQNPVAGTGDESVGDPALQEVEALRAEVEVLRRQLSELHLAQPASEPSSTAFAAPLATTGSAEPESSPDSGSSPELGRNQPGGPQAGRSQAGRAQAGQSSASVGGHDRGSRSRTTGEMNT